MSLAYNSGETSYPQVFRMKRTDDRNAERRADYRVNKRKEKRAKQFAAKIVGFLNGTLKLCSYMDIGDSRDIDLGPEV